MSKQISIKYGILAGIATIGYYLLFYLFKAESIFYLGVWWAGWLPSLIIMVIGLNQLRKQQDNKLEYLEGLRTAFLIYVLAMLLFYIFYYLLLKYFDPDLMQAQQEVALKNYQRFGPGTEQEKEELMEMYQEEAPVLKLSTILFGYLGSLIGGFIVSLGAAYAMRK